MVKIEIWQALFVRIFPPFITIEYVKDGTLDILITKPISLQFIVTLRYINFGWACLNLIAGIEMIIIAFIRLNITISVAKVAGTHCFLVYKSGILASTYIRVLGLQHESASS